MDSNSQRSQTKAVLTSFREMHKLFRKWGLEVISKSDLTMPQFWILQVIQAGVTMPQKTLVEHLQFSKSTLSTSIEGLVSAGLIERSIPENNRREVQLKLTAKGEQQVQQIFEDPSGLFQRMNRALKKLSPEKIESLLSIQEELYELLLEE
ncbi:MarR family winged helix-turn-helix transcriptional regulator [Heyndrickxia ginsengihumi]|uniref:Winged helix DNA-binding protein n=1 Tax=Heyndrickxia ginsengihumi TaxID=363870 RepID=A0A6M0P1I2_9BACI|nr:MarR family transcriptional regulator [Heyndrickxia ginsengihumi]MBE6183749.1 MarR family transcriptional regulator [Bacillus sp. (in: firmicutes)]MCM3022243.1 MarR family transcriptional regulator [Heyndrickxia ginsengihumi]NEY18476.1 winged helix DNA-binding protein [Heyndrickxia ginsengihumi]